MKASTDSERVAHLAHLAGFCFPPHRCELLAPELEWLMTEAARIRAVSRADKEPVSIFRPTNSVAIPAKEETERHE